MLYMCSLHVMRAPDAFLALYVFAAKEQVPQFNSALLFRAKKMITWPWNRLHGKGIDGACCHSQDCRVLSSLPCSALLIPSLPPLDPTLAPNA